MVAFNYINDFWFDLGKGEHDFDVDSLRIALSNTAPASETSDPTANGNGVLANVTQISYTNYTDDSTTDREVENVTWSQSGADAVLTGDHITITASGGSIADFRYVYLYNSAAAGSALIGYWDNGSTVSLTDGSTLEIDFGGDAGTNGELLSLTRVA